MPQQATDSKNFGENSIAMLFSPKFFIQMSTSLRNKLFIYSTH